MNCIKHPKNISWRNDFFWHKKCYPREKDQPRYASAADLAIIQMNSKLTPSDVENIVDLTDIAEEDDLKLGDRIYSIGFPLSFTIGGTDIGLEANNQSGEVTQERGEYVYGHNITIHKGASGSPVFDAYGKFAGVIVSGFIGVSSGYNQAVHPQKAVELLKH